MLGRAVAVELLKDLQILRLWPARCDSAFSPSGPAAHSEGRKRSVYSGSGPFRPPRFEMRSQCCVAGRAGNFPAKQIRELRRPCTTERAVAAIACDTYI